MSPSRSVNLFLFLFILLNGLLLASARLYPFIDLPNHLAEATIYKYADEPGNPLGQYYEAVPAFYPNTFHTVFCSLFPSVELGNKVFYILYLVLMLLSVFLVIRELKGNPWYGLLSVLLVYNFNVSGGFSGYVIALPVTLLLFYTALRDIRNDRFINKIAASLLLVLLYLMHAQMALFGLLLYGALMLYQYRRNFKKLLGKLVFIPLPLIVMIAAWWMHRSTLEEESTTAYLVDYYTADFWTEFPMRLRLPLFDHFSLYGGAAGLAVALLLTGLLVLPLIYFKVWKNLRGGGWKSPQVIYPLLFLLISAGCYFVLPDALPGQAPLYERFSTLVLLALLVLGAVLLKEVRVRGLRVFAVAAGLLYTGLWAEYFYSFNKENRGFTAEFFKEIPEGARLGGLIYDYRFRGRYLYLHFPNYHLVWNGGLVASKTIDYRFGVVRRGPSGDRIPYYEEWIGRTFQVPADYQTKLEFLLEKGRAPVQPDPNLKNFQPVRQAGAWELYQNTQLQ